MFSCWVVTGHGGSHGVDTNWYTVVLDGGWLPIARGLKASMRMQAARGVTALWGHSGWGVPGGGVLLSARGTLGIALAVLNESLESCGRFFEQAHAGEYAQSKARAFARPAVKVK